jgi:hypothetical protein
MSLTGAQIQDAQIKPKHVPKIRFKIWKKKNVYVCLRSAAVFLYIRSDFMENGTIFVRAKVSKIQRIQNSAAWLVILTRSLILSLPDIFNSHLWGPLAVRGLLRRVLVWLPYAQDHRMATALSLHVGLICGMVCHKISGQPQNSLPSFKRLLKAWLFGKHFWEVAPWTRVTVKRRSI